MLSLSSSPGSGLPWPGVPHAAPEPERPDLALLSRQLAAEVTADRTLANRLEQEAGPLETQVQQAQQDLVLSRMQAKEAYDIQQRMTDLERSLEGQIHAAKEQLQRLTEERRQLTELFCSGAVDKERAAKSRQLLEQVLDEEARALEETRDSNVFLEESCRGLLQQLSVYEAEHETLLLEVEDETTAHEGHEKAYGTSVRNFAVLTARADPRSRPGV
mmetsp:Transcript_1374/g.2940  ORF Transcript_1374/g.2940 Transcript_1374/m.2940 type:complete len:217 (-) Transcript_1374:43-693(-)